jgi:hypothetical protein
MASNTYPIPNGIAQLLQLAALSEDSRTRLLDQRSNAAEPAGVALTRLERTILDSISRSQLELMIDHQPAPPSRRRLLGQAAAAATLVLGGLVKGGGSADAQDVEQDTEEGTGAPAESDSADPLGHGFRRPDTVDMRTTGGADPHYLDHRQPARVTVESVDLQTGEANLEAVRHEIHRRLSLFQSCYRTGLATNPDLTGRVVASIDLLPSGEVADVQLQSSTLNDSAVVDCMVHLLRRVRFPESSDPALVRFSLSLHLTPD